MRARLWIAAAILVCRSAAAQEAPNEKERARQHFQDGLKRAQAGELRSALEAFQAAYAASPHFSVLYNIAQTQLALSQPAEATQTFERYLAEGGTSVPPARRREVQAVMAKAREQAGEARSTPEAASTAPAASKPRAGQIQIQCATPDMAVFLDGVAVGQTPLAKPLLADLGPHRIRIERPGYASSERSLSVDQDGFVSIACADRPLAPLPAVLSAQLQVKVTPAWAEVLVDGRIYSGAPLVAGRHKLRLQADAHVPEERVVTLSAGKISQLLIALKPTARELERREQARSHRKTAGYVLGSSGIAILATGGGLLIWNQGRYSDWQESAMGSSGDVDRAVSIQRVDDLSLALMVVGTGLAGGAAWLLLW